MGVNEQGPRSKFSSGGGGGGLKKNERRNFNFGRGGGKGWGVLNRANAFFQFENPLEIKQTSLPLAARRFDFAFCCMQMKHNTESLCSL